MSFLTPLYVLGLLAVAAPIVFHLIRRTPRGEMPFSSLMFLSPTPPRLTRRSRLDDWLLLLLRATALVLLAVAFTRPFLRQQALADPVEAGGRRIAVLVDTSASMRRADLWPQARAMAQEVIASSVPADRLAVFAFDVATRPLLGFEESATLDPAQLRATVKSRLAALEPSWGATNLGQALVDAAAAIGDLAESGKKKSAAAAADRPDQRPPAGEPPRGTRRARMAVATSSSRSEDCQPRARTPGCTRCPTVEGGEPNAADTRAGVRVSNDAASRRESFELFWVDERGAEAGKPVPAYVPPGESRVVRVPRPAGSATYRGLRLKGDAHAFDNTLYLAAEPRRRGDRLLRRHRPRRRSDRPPLLPGARLPRDGAAGASRSVPSRRPLSCRSTRAFPCRWSSLTGGTTPANVEKLRKFLQEGGTVLYVLGAKDGSETLAALAGTAPSKFEEKSIDRGVLLSEIAFDHPLFAPLAGPQFNDFTKIHFWKYRRIAPESLGDARVLARFEGGDPAVVEKTPGKGWLVVLASGWAPGRQPARAIVEVLPAHVGISGWAEPAPFRRDDPAGARSRAVAGARARPGLGPGRRASRTGPGSRSSRRAASSPTPTSRASTRSRPPAVPGRSR